eukprot:CAMPEP_0170064316 /NCGR_PEP_ID=MMETSP0019_2-20121128/4847_1 /TAXON_ID=98059 /ORGANISM="Dinobryon sp., Strain UTEXLB2267" /LENGTH=197 /DNA_ID=CAMNT_0010270951 /DNA_START=493 /DNA_END=1086 /DNA_ORIENTATION=+
MGNEGKLPISSRIIDKSGRESRLENLCSANPSAVVPKASISIDDKDLESLVSSGHSFGDLLVAVESVRLSVVAFTVSRDCSMFPMIYVNKAFEELTGYTRCEAVGRHFQFLQSECTEKDQIELMTKSLSAAQTVKVMITNRRKDGSDVLILLTMKPVFNSKGVYSYVFGVQCNYSQTDEDIQLIDDLLSVFPNVLKI